MQKKIIDFQIKGMRRDLSISKADPNYAYEIINMRLTTNDSENLLSLVNEKGNFEISLTEDGETPFTFGEIKYIGHCVINQYLVLFVIQHIDNNVWNSLIYSIDFNDVTTISNKEHYKIKLVFGSTQDNDLQFSEENPIETLGDYETESVIKVYFTDGVQQPRVVDIKRNYNKAGNYNSDELNFVRSLKNTHTITVSKQSYPGSLFSPGVIQYCMSYYNLHGQESNIFYVSPLYYISDSDRGNAPDDTSVGSAFSIKFENLDVDYEYARIYSIRRTSINTTPIVKRVADIKIPTEDVPIYFIDNNSTGEEIDPSLLYYIGGEPISAGTFEAKDGTLFLGNINLKRHIITGTDNSVWTVKDNGFKNDTLVWTFPRKEIVTSIDDPSIGNTTYNYEFELNKNNSDITIFKSDETYRLGFQLQHKSGVWSDAYWLADKTMNERPVSSLTSTIFNNFKVTIQSSEEEINHLNSLGYVAIRPVIVYPKPSERKVLCQGMVCPTVFNIKDRYDNTIYAQASWFARPIPVTYGYTDSFANGAGIEYRHNHMLHPSSVISNEIQSMDEGSVGDNLHAQKFWKSGAITQEYSDNYSDYYFVDNSIVTLNTPELYDSTFNLIENGGETSKYSFRIVGAIPINATTSDINILASAPFEGDTCEVIWKKENSVVYHDTIKLGAVNKKFSFTDTNGWKHSPTYPQWIDRKVTETNDINTGNNNDTYIYTIAGTYVSPWHKTGQFLPSKKRLSIKEKHLTYLEPQYDAGVLKEKKMSHLLFSYNTWFTNYVNFNNSSISCYNSDEPVSTRIRVPEFSFGRYQGNVDKVLIKGLINNGKYIIRNTVPFSFSARQNFPDSNLDTNVYITPNGNTLNEKYNNMLNSNIMGGTDSTMSDPIRIKYKSTPHFVISLNPTPSSNNTNDPIKVVLPYKENGPTTEEQGKSIGSAVSLGNMIGSGYIWLGEIINNSIDSNIRFGGQSEEALISNDWVVGGNPTKLKVRESHDVVIPNINLVWDRGDTYYQRYDCLKTYPYTLEDENSIVEVVSFMCETRVNIDGRYDKNRGTASLVAHPTNFNLINPVYSQRDNFFIYRGFNSLNKIENFPNQITWTVTKSPNSEIDKWTNITLASTLNLDGDKGEIKRIEKFRNDLFAFQEKGISRILFNDRTALSTTNGLPVELANSGRVEGKMYFTELEGLTNKVSIKTTPNGIYFIDGKTKTAYLFNGQQCLSLSDTKAMKIFFTGQPDNFRIFYDSKEKDVYFVNSNYCLCYSEKLGEFAGFFSYENVPLMENVKDKFLSLYNNDIWEHYIGNYNSFYGVTKPHSITFIGNDNLPFDKIYTNIEFISDSFLNNEYVSTKTFDHLKVWDEYQTGEESLVDTNGRPSNLKKKFRIWRAHLPRANWNGRDRIRNPWCFVQLRMDNPSIYKTILHKVNLEYYM